MLAAGRKSTSATSKAQRIRISSTRLSNAPGLSTRRTQRIINGANSMRCFQSGDKSFQASSTRFSGQPSTVTKLKSQSIRSHGWRNPRRDTLSSIKPSLTFKTDMIAHPNKSSLHHKLSTSPLQVSHSVANHDLHLLTVYPISSVSLEGQQGHFIILIY